MPSSSRGLVPAQPPDDAARLDAVVHGRVQGVGFRYFVIDIADDLELAGWVANEPDGSVRCVAEGPRPRLESLLEELRLGPPGARVARIDHRWLPPSGTLGPFTVRSGAHRGD